MNQPGDPWRRTSEMLKQYVGSMSNEKIAEAKQKVYYQRAHPKHIEVNATVYIEVYLRVLKYLLQKQVGITHKPIAQQYDHNGDQPFYLLRGTREVSVGVAAKNGIGSKVDKVSEQKGCDNQVTQ